VPTCFGVAPTHKGQKGKHHVSESSLTDRIRRQRRGTEFSPEDTPVTVLSVATRTSWKNKETSQWASSTEWHRIVCWSKLAKFAGSLKSGAHVQIEGEFRNRAYEKDGVSHRIWECKASRIAKLDRIERADETSSGDETTEDQPPL